MNPFLYILLFSCSGSFAGFLESPSSFNASQGSNVTFHCHINESGNILFWLVNNEFSNSISNQNRSISLIKFSNLRSILTIQAHTWNDNVEIQCAYRSYQSTSLNCSSQTVTCSERAILRIQGLLSPPSNLSGKPVPGNSAILLTWTPPPSLDLTGVDPDIMYYEISVPHNKTGQTVNFTAPRTEYTYHLQRAHNNDLCQELEFSVLAVNNVGRGSKSTINVALHKAPSLKLLDTENSMQENSKIECTTTCNNLITWTSHTLLDVGSGHWYDVIATNRSGLLCSETIAIAPVWLTESANAVSVQCVAVSVCPNGTTPSCLQGVCLSDIQEVLIQGFNQATTNMNIENEVNTMQVIGLICGSTVFLIVLGLLILIVIILTIKSGTSRLRARRYVLNNCSDNGNKEDRIYESPTEFATEQMEHNTKLELCHNLNPGSLYSLPLPTDPCLAYDTIAKKL